MPRGNQRGVAEGYRRCAGCGSVFPADSRYFYTRSNGTFERCQGDGTNNCRAEYFRSYSARMRAAAQNAPTGDATIHGRQFGMEFEFVGERETVARIVRETLGVACIVEPYNHTVAPFRWKVVQDGSLQSATNETGELVTPPMSGAEAEQNLTRLLSALTAAGIRVNRSCGHHVHLDLADYSARDFGRLYALWSQISESLTQLVAPSRRYSNWCAPVPARMIQGAMSNAAEYGDRPLSRPMVANFIARDDRYYSLNGDAFTKYGTVENRMHGGTLDAAKVLSWLSLNRSILALAKSDETLPNDELGVAELLRLLVEKAELSPVHAAYLTYRAEAFRGMTPATDDEDS